MPNYQPYSLPSQHPKATCLGIEKDGEPINYGEFIQLLKNDQAFRLFYSQLLAQSEYKAFYWEHLPVNKDSLTHQVYKFVLYESPSLTQKTARPQGFSDYFLAGEQVVCFPNLSGKGRLVVPCPIGTEHEKYTHLATFVRNAEASQQDAFWKRVGIEFEKFVNHQPTWLSTAGLGVHWLHARLFHQPKYYRYQPYTKWKE